MDNLQVPQTDIGRFYYQIGDFKKKIVGIFQKLNKNEEITKLHKYHEKLLMAKQANVRFPIEMFYKYGVQTYCTQILTRDESFFLGQAKNLQTIQKFQTEEITYDVSDHDLLFIGQISQIWDFLNEKVKDNIWNYVQIICLLAEKIVGGHILADEKVSLQKIGILK